VAGTRTECDRLGVRTGRVTLPERRTGRRGRCSRRVYPSNLGKYPQAFAVTTLTDFPSAPLPRTRPLTIFPAVRFRSWGRLDNDGGHPARIAFPVAEESGLSMRRLLYVSVLFLVGCQNTVGPRERGTVRLSPDCPGLSIEEQKKVGRDRLALPETSRALVPRDYSDFTGPYNP
jgi:hypothetical protein